MSTVKSLREISPNCYLLLSRLRDRNSAFVRRSNRLPPMRNQRSSLEKG